MNGIFSDGKAFGSSHSGSRRRWTSTVAAFMALAVLGLYFAVPAGALGSSTFNGTDGTLDAGAAGLIVKDDTPSGSGDNSFAEGVHEDTAVPPAETGGVPDKADLQNFHLAVENAGGHDYLYLSWERKPDQGGTTDMDFEFNQSETLTANGVTPVRTVNDLLITYAIANGGTTVEMAYRLWEGSDWSSEHLLGAFAEGSYNTDANGDHYFGEAVIDLTASGLFPTGQCVSFGSAYLKSRSSHSFESKMKDFIAPVPVFVSNCGRIVVHKDTVPNASTGFSFTTTGTGLSSFSLVDDGDGTLSNTKSFVNLLPGSYSVTEGAASGYDLTSLTCTTSADSSGTRAGSKANIEITAGSVVDCTFVNTAQAAHLNVIKHVVNDNGGDAAASAFAIEVEAGGATPSSFQGQESPGTSVTLDAGSFSVTETEVSGYAATYDGCSGTIGRGETRTCTITNDDQPPGLEVIKNVINDNGGTKTPADFEMNVTAPGEDPEPFPGSAAGTEIGLSAGAYSVTEGSHGGYSVGYSEDCEGSIGIGQTKTCTVTNDDIQPKLIVKKEVVNDDGGTLLPGDFSLNVAGSAPIPASVPGSEAGAEIAINAGSYSVAETAVDGYAASYSDNCSGTITVGQTRTCTVINDDAAPGLTVIKHVVNDNGGTLEAEDFDIEVTGSSVDPAEFPGDEAGTEVSLMAGLYSVTEAEDDGYAATYSPDCTGAIGLGQSKVCTITNDDIQPKLTVVKTVDNDNGGNLEPDDFTLAVDGESAVPASFPGSAVGAEVAINAGSYSVTELEVDGYAGTFSEGCSGELAVGETATCTVTNSDLPAGLTVIKRVINDKGGRRSAPDFRISVDSTGTDPEPFQGSETGTLVQIDAGTYEVTEEEVRGYLGTLSEGCEGTIALDEARVCTITNNDVAAEVRGVVINNTPQTPTPETPVTPEPPAEFVEVLGVTLPQTGINIALGLTVALILLSMGFGLVWFSRKTLGPSSKVQ